MSSTTFTIVSTQFSYYVGLPIFVFGVVGNLINICLLFPTRSISCSFLLLVSSIFSLIALCVGLLPRVLSIGFSVDSSSTSIIWCKSRLFLSYIGSLTSLACVCFASIDRFFVTCRNVTWRNRSQLSTAKLATFITILIIISINVPYPIFFSIVEVRTATGNITARCVLGDPRFVLYGNYFLRPVLLSLIPGTILIITGFRTYRNITSIGGIQLRGTFQRSLTTMILLQIVTIVIPIAPFATINIYQSITSSMIKTPYRLAQETLASDITNIFLYVSYASNFYIYLLSASSYRRDFIRFVCCSGRHHSEHRIGPMVREQLEMNTASAIKKVTRTTN